MICNNFWWNKWACQVYSTDAAWTPSKILKTYPELGAPEIETMKGVQQEPAFHDEGDCYNHSLLVCDAMSVVLSREGVHGRSRGIFMLAAICHDFGKPKTTIQKEKNGVLCWTAPGHDLAGVPLARQFLRRIEADDYVIEKVCSLVRHHMVHTRKDSFSSKSVRKLAKSLGPVTIAELCLLMEADCRGRGPKTMSGLPDGILNKLIPTAKTLGVFDYAEPSPA